MLLFFLNLTNVYRFISYIVNDLWQATTNQPADEPPYPAASPVSPVVIDSPRSPASSTDFDSPRPPASPVNVDSPLPPPQIDLATSKWVASNAILDYWEVLKAHFPQLSACSATRLNVDDNFQVEEISEGRATKTVAAIEEAFEKNQPYFFLIHHANHYYVLTVKQVDGEQVISIADGKNSTDLFDSHEEWLIEGFLSQLRVKNREQTNNWVLDAVKIEHETLPEECVQRNNDDCGIVATAIVSAHVNRMPLSDYLRKLSSEMEEEPSTAVTFGYQELRKRMKMTLKSELIGHSYQYLSYRGINPPNCTL